MGSYPIWDSDFFRVYVIPRIYLIYHYIIVCKNIYIIIILSGKILPVQPVPQCDTMIQSIALTLSVKVLQSATICIDQI